MRATRRKVNVNSRTARGLATSHEYSSNLDGQTLIFHFACTWHTTEPRVVSAARNTKHSTERRDWKAVAFTMDEYESHGLLLAKNSAAFFRISKSIHHAFVLTPQTHELLTLVRCERASASRFGVDLGALHPFAQCVLADVEITRDAKGSCDPRSGRAEQPLF